MERPHRKALAIVVHNRQETQVSLGKSHDSPKQSLLLSNIRHQNSDQTELDELQLRDQSPRNGVDFEVCWGISKGQKQSLGFEIDSAQEVRMQLEELVDECENQYPISESSATDSVSVWFLSPSTAAPAFSETASQISDCSFSEVDDDCKSENSTEQVRRDLEKSFAEGSEPRGCRRGSFCEWIIDPTGSVCSIPPMAHVCDLEIMKELHDDGEALDPGYSGPCAGMATLRAALIGDVFTNCSCPALNAWCSSVGIKRGEELLLDSKTSQKRFEFNISLHQKTETCSSWMLL